MERTIQLFLKNREGFWGPLSVRGLRERLSSTGYTEDTLVSLDGTKWFSAQKIEGIVKQRKQASPAPVHAFTPAPTLAEPMDPELQPLATEHVVDRKTEDASRETTARAIPQPTLHPMPDILPQRLGKVEVSPSTPAGNSPAASKATATDRVKEGRSAPAPDGEGSATPGGTPKKKAVPTNKNNAQRNESRERLRSLLTRVQDAAKRLPWIFPWSVAGVFFASTGALIGLACGLLYILPLSLSLEFFALAALLPCVLGGAALSHLAGNMLLRILTGLSDKERRCLALHLPWRSTPAEWPRYLRKWMYTGDWLVEDFGSDLLPYVRAFITGPAPESLETELDLWAELMSGTRAGGGGHDFEVGHSVREMACVQRLPSWAKDVMPGMTLQDLELQLGKAGREWAMSLIRRAARRKKIFHHIDLEGDLHEVSFEFHFCEMDAGREGLLVIIRPRLDDRSLSYLDESRSDELAAA